MGEVYRARDTSLSRDIAIKILPAEVAADPERLARFKREAQLLAALNHPNIAAIHGLDQADGKPFLVLELVEGEDLAQRLQRGPISLDEARPIAKQIAEALEEAHEHGIVHRDLKPGNIKVTADGKVKVLDFGLAKAFSGDAPPGIQGDLSHSPTLSHQGTYAGVILGTAAYMSPEQARGKPVDKRADIWAFGVVLFEMLTGARLFHGETVSDTLAAVLRKDPDWRFLPRQTPTRIRELLEHCLTRDPKERLRDIGHARQEIERVGSGGAQADTEAVTVPGLRRALPWAVAILGVAGSWALFRRPATPAAPARLSIGLGAPTTLDLTGFGGGTGGTAVALSPDGSLLAFVGSKEGENSQLFVRRLDQLQATPLRGSEGAHSPFFSPDGQSIAFFADGQLKRVSITGGASVVLAEAPLDRGGTWSTDGTIFFTPDSAPGVGLSRVPASGGVTEVFTRPDPAVEEVTHRWPQALPGGKAVLFTTDSQLGYYDNASIVAQSLPSGARKVVVKGGYYGRFLPSGHVVYMHEGTLFAIPFDLSRLEPKGSAVPVIEELVGAPTTGAAHFGFSDYGTLAYLPGRSLGGQLTINWLGNDGKLSPLRAQPGRYRSLRFSPDGTKLAMQVLDGNSSDIWVYEWGRDTMTRLTFDVVGLTVPVWAPDGRSICYTSARPGRRGNVYSQKADGTGKAQLLEESNNIQITSSWHPSGRYLAFEDLSRETRQDVMILPIETDGGSGWKPGKATPFLNSRFSEQQVAFSPNGRWIAYASDESRKFEVYVRPFPGPGGKWQISTEGGSWPTWSQNGRELFYESRSQRLMVVSYGEQGDSFHADVPRQWSEVRIPFQYIRGFDLHPDGQRFAVLHEVTGLDQSRRDQVVLFLNFFDELRRLAPAK